MLWIATLGLLLSDRGKNGRKTLTQMWDLGFNYLSTSYTISQFGQLSLAAIVILANIPQILISFAYIAYNGILTAMLAAAEYCDFSTDRKPLRVSSPHGMQRSTYFLQIPYRYSIPLMTMMALLHWLASESIFLARLDVLDYDGSYDSSLSIDGLGYSLIAEVFSLLVGGLLIISLPLLGFRRLTGGIPIVAGNSMAISAACHRADYEDEGIVSKTLQYGVLRCRGLTGKRRAAFSGEAVESLVKGDVYD